MPVDKKFYAQLHALNLLNAVTDFKVDKPRRRRLAFNPYDYSCKNNDIEGKKHKDLSLSCFLAFSLVRNPGEVAAAYVDVKSGKVTIYLAKNELEGTDKALASELKEYTLVALENRGLKTTEFAFGYLDILLKYSSLKVRTLVEAVRTGGPPRTRKPKIGKIPTATATSLKDIIQKLKDAAPVKAVHEMEARKKEKKMKEGRRKGDHNLLAFAKEANRSVGRCIIAALSEIQRRITKSAESSGEGLYTASYYSHMIGTSMIARDILENTLKDSNITERLLPALSKLGRYAAGIERLYAQSRTCFRGANSRARIDLVFVESQQRKITLAHTAEEILIDTYQQSSPITEIGSNIRKDISILAKRIEADWNPSLELNLHCEIALILHLREFCKITRGEIGVSKRCCSTCWHMINEGFNKLKPAPDAWILDDNHGTGKHYPVLECGIEKIDQKAADHVNSELVRLIEDHLRQLRNLESAAVPSSPDLAPYKEPKDNVTGAMLSKLKAEGLYAESDDEDEFVGVSSDPEESGEEDEESGEEDEDDSD